MATSRLREMHLLGVRTRVNVLEWGLPLAVQTMGVVDVLGEESVKVRAIVGKLAVNDGVGAIEASLLSVRGADGDVQGCQGVAKRRSEHVCWAEPRPWYEAGDLGFSRVVACVSRPLCDLSDGVVPTRSLTERATGGVESASDQEARVACGTHCGLHWPCTTQAEAHRIKKKKKETRQRAGWGPCGGSISIARCGQRPGC